MDYMISNFCDEANHPVFNSKGTSPSNVEALLSSRDRASDEEHRLPPEMELGNIEYKAKLINPSTMRMQNLITQMQWRLREGQGEAIYEIGAADDGALIGMTDTELNSSLATLRTMADALCASMVVLTERDVTPRGVSMRRTVVEVLIRKVPESQQFIELRLAVLGGCDVGKSTFCGVMTHGSLDDGTGKTRLNLFRFPHEVRTGKTSSVCSDVIGFDARGKLINYAQHNLEELVERATKLVTLIDLAGDAKYIKTTIHGLSGYRPHFACLLVAADTGPNSITKEHLGLAAALHIPLFICITKKDLVDKPQLERVIRSITALIHRAGMTPFSGKIRNKRDVIKAAAELSSTGVVPILSFSSVTGEGLRLLRCFLNVLPPSNGSRQVLANKPLHFSIDEIYRVPHVGNVVCGLLSQGQMREGDTLLIGPMRDGLFEKVSVASIRRSKQPVQAVMPGEAASVAIQSQNGAMIALRRGMVLLSISKQPIAVNRFSVNMLLLSHCTRNLCIGFQATVFIGSVSQTACVVEMDKPCLQQGQWATVTLQFCFNPEFIQVGIPLILRQGRTKGMGQVLELLDN